MENRRAWTNSELLLAFRLYCYTPFGKLHQHNPDIIDLAKRLGRTPSAVAMKACNFASLDPIQQERKTKGLQNASKDDRKLWEEFKENPEAVAVRVEAAAHNILSKAPEESDQVLDIPEGPTENTQLVRIRCVQSFFRNAVLTSYEHRCALSDIALPALLNASHIIPWKNDVARRADPSNGILLNALLDRAFDRGLVTFDESFRLIVSNQLKKGQAIPYQRESLVGLEGKQLRLPYRFSPDPQAITYHREHIFQE